MSINIRSQERILTLSSSPGPARTPPPRNPSGAVHPTVFLLAWAVLGLGLSSLIPLHLPAWPALRYLAGVVTLGGVLLFGWSALEFWKHGTTMEHKEPTTAVITRGPFRLSRHPVYVALVAVLLGIAIEYDNAWFLLLTAGFAVAMHRFTVLREEAYLEREFGDEYRSYRAAVRRWL